MCCFFRSLVSCCQENKEIKKKSCFVGYKCDCDVMWCTHFGRKNSKCFCKLLSVFSELKITYKRIPVLFAKESSTKPKKICRRSNNNKKYYRNFNTANKCVCFLFVSEAKKRKFTNNSVACDCSQPIDAQPTLLTTSVTNGVKKNSSVKWGF